MKSKFVIFPLLLISLTHDVTHGEESNLNNYKVIVFQLTRIEDDKDVFSIEINGVTSKLNKESIIQFIDKTRSKNLTIIYNGGVYSLKNKEILLEIQKLRNASRLDGVFTHYINTAKFKNKSNHNLIYECTREGEEYLKIGNILLTKQDDINKLSEIGISRSSMSRGVAMTSSETVLAKLFIDKMNSEKIPIIQPDMKLVFSDSSIEDLLKRR